MQPKIIFIGGPTASGKSALALKLAATQLAAIINTDAMQVYKGFPLLSAQPERPPQNHTPHYLYEIFPPTFASSAGHWKTQAHTTLKQVTAEGRTPIFVGGTGLYFLALLGGLANIPEIPATLRAEVTSLYAQIGHESFRALLAKQDPLSAARIAQNDKQRLIRALEVVTHTKTPLSSYQTQNISLSHTSATIEGTTYCIERHLLLPPREKLYAACDARFLNMLKNGAWAEAQNARMLNLAPEHPALKILGLRELIAAAEDKISAQDAITKAQQATRNYAKRQRTWFKNQWPLDQCRVYENS